MDLKNGDRIIEVLMIGKDGEDLSALIEEYIERVEGIRELFDHVIRVANRPGWSCGQRKHLMPGIWAVRVR